VNRDFIYLFFCFLAVY